MKRTVIDKNKCLPILNAQQERLKDRSAPISFWKHEENVQTKLSEKYKNIEKALSLSEEKLHKSNSI